MLTKNELIKELQSKIFKISFKFCNGEIKHYIITLNKDIIPKKAFLTIGPETIFATVYDIDNKKWIGFCWEKIYKLEEINGTV